MATRSPAPGPSPEHIFNTLNAYHQTAALKTAIELDLFTPIDEGHQRVEDIAKRVQASPRGVRILCDYLTMLGFLKKENESYSLSPDVGLFLNRNSRAYFLPMSATSRISRSSRRQFDGAERRGRMDTIKLPTMNSGYPSHDPWRH
jgi:hypothetical protein